MFQKINFACTLLFFYVLLIHFNLILTVFYLQNAELQVQKEEKLLALHFWSELMEQEL